MGLFRKPENQYSESREQTAKLLSREQRKQATDSGKTVMSLYEEAVAEGDDEAAQDWRRILGD